MSTPTPFRPDEIIPWGDILGWMNVAAYFRQRRVICKNPGPATADPAAFDWHSMSRFLVQGLFVPSLVLMLITPLVRKYNPHFGGPSLSAKLTQRISELQAQDATMFQVNDPQAWSRSGNSYALWLLESLNREMSFRRWAIRTLVMAILLVPISIVVATLVFPYRSPRTATGPMSDPLRVRATLVYILGSHLFWLNAANATVAALLFGMMEAVPSYYVILLFETAYLLLVVLILGTLTDRASMGLRMALQLKMPGKPLRFVGGDSIKADLITLYFITGIALTGLIRLVW